MKVQITFQFPFEVEQLFMSSNTTGAITFEVTKSDSNAWIISVFSGLIGLTGGLSNLASLSYFITREEKSLSRRIFIMLNAFDLLVCTALVPSVLLYFCTTPLQAFSQLSYRICYAFFNLGVECTALSTCLLGILRLIAIRFPYYQVRKKVLVVVSMTFIYLEIFREILRLYFFFLNKSNLAFYLKFHNAAMISVLTLAIAINSISSILLSMHLLGSSKRPGSGRNNNYNQKSMTKSSRRGTVTILILSTSFLVCNSLYGISLYILISRRLGPQTPKPSAPKRLLGNILLWSIIPLNSALNPLVYFLRRKEMRNFIRNLLTKKSKRVAGEGSSGTG